MSGDGEVDEENKKKLLAIACNKNGKEFGLKWRDWEKDGDRWWEVKKFCSQKDEIDKIEFELKPKEGESHEPEAGEWGLSAGDAGKLKDCKLHLAMNGAIAALYKPDAKCGPASEQCAAALEQFHDVMDIAPKKILNLLNKLSKTEAVGDGDMTEAAEPPPRKRQKKS